MDSSTVSEQRISPATGLDGAVVEQPEASTVKNANEALLQMCKEMSATLQRLELHLATRVQAGGKHATSTTKIVEEVTRAQENPIAEVNRGHEETDVLPVIVNPSEASDNRERPPHFPLTVYYKCEPDDKIKRIKDDCKLSGVQLVLRALPRDGTMDLKVVDNLPQSNTSLDWKYYVPLYKDSLESSWDV
ncbi:hypothetical protein N431DRAFT_485761, partial [Stipitochalara longipes BDJ]